MQLRLVSDFLKDGDLLKNVVYSSDGCVFCKALKMMLKSHNIEYDVLENCSNEYLFSLGINSLPAMNVDGEIKNYKQSIEWINSLKNGDDQNAD